MMAVTSNENVHGSYQIAHVPIDIDKIYFLLKDRGIEMADLVG